MWILFTGENLRALIFKSSQVFQKLEPETLLSWVTGVAAKFDDLVKFGDRRQIRRSRLFIKLAFEFGCDVVFVSHPITQSLGSKLR